MARILEETFDEKKIRCPHCGKLVGFTLKDVWSSYDRGLEYSDGWIDADCLWHYIDCPNCQKTIAVNDIKNSPLDNSDRSYLESKYENKWNDYD